MVPFATNPNLPRAIREIVLKAMQLPHTSQALEYMAIKSRQMRREFRKYLKLAMLHDEQAYVDLIRFLRRSGIRNPWLVSDYLRRTTSTATNEEILSCLSQAVFEHGHAAMEIASALGDLRSVLERARRAEEAHAGARQDYLCAEGFERECDLLLARRS